MEAQLDEHLVLGQSRVVGDHFKDRLVFLHGRLRDVSQRHLERLLALYIEAHVATLNDGLTPVPALVRKVRILKLVAEGLLREFANGVLVCGAEAIELVHEASLDA